MNTTNMKLNLLIGVSYDRHKSCKHHESSFIYHTIKGCSKLIIWNYKHKDPENSPKKGKKCQPQLMKDLYPTVACYIECLLYRC